MLWNSWNHRYKIVSRWEYRVLKNSGNVMPFMLIKPITYFSLHIPPQHHISSHVRADLVKVCCVILCVHISRAKKSCLKVLKSPNGKKIG